LILVVDLVLIVMVGGLLYLNLNRPHHPRIFRPGAEAMQQQHKGPDMLKELGLSAEQAQKMESHKEAFRAKSKESMHTLMAKRREIADELSKPTVDLEKIKTLHQELKAAMNQTQDELLQDIITVRDILGPEKFKLFSEKIGKGMGHGTMMRPGCMGKPEGEPVPPPMDMQGDME